MTDQLEVIDKPADDTWRSECRVGHIFRRETNLTWRPYATGYQLVRGAVDKGNRERGAGTHWVEFR